MSAREHRRVTAVLGALLAGALVVACSDAPDQTKPRRGSPTGAADGSGDGAGGGAAPGGVACPTDLAAPAQIATDVDATNVRAIAGSIFFQAGTKLVRVAGDGARTEVYASDDLVSAYTDGKTVAAVESPNPPDAVLRLSDVGGDPDDAAEVDTNLTAASTRVFGADAAAFYAVSDGDDGDKLYRIARDNPGLDTIAETGGVVSFPQVANGALWYVKDQNDVYMLPLQGDGAEPKLVFSVEGGCALAVGASHVFCSTAGALEERDLTGANPKKLFDAESSRLPSAFGEGLAAGDTIVVRSATGEGPLKNVIRAVSSGSERVVACGRDAIGSMSSDGTVIAWVETGKGVFSAK
jgi:hypothetical protein